MCGVVEKSAEERWEVLKSGRLGRKGRVCERGPLGLEGVREMFLAGRGSIWRMREDRASVPVV